MFETREFSINKNGGGGGGGLNHTKQNLVTF